jgi:hypothetical protein
LKKRVKTEGTGEIKEMMMVIRIKD